MNELLLGTQLMLYGISGVFIVLILFYILIAVLTKIFPGE